jgi:aryl-alcohol dehydrogenase-like predicted oxidoreductase
VINLTFDLAGTKGINRLGFGAMRITGRGIWGEPRDPAESRRVLERAIELGINFIDTANSYGPHVSERLIGETLRPYREDLVIATKGGFKRPGPGRWEADCRPEMLKEACEGSLQRLGLETIELYQLHTVDRRVPYEDSVGALKELQDEGKVRHVGVSNVSRDQLSRAQSIVDVVSVQNNYSVSRRDSEDVLDVCEQQGIAFIPWYPIASGDLAKPGGALDAIAQVHNATPAQVSLAWLLHRSPAMIPIPGTSSVAHLEENTAARDLELTDDDLKRIEDAIG